MASVERNYVHRTKYDRKPFSFRWEIEQFPHRLYSVGDRLDSPVFEAAPGVQMFLRLNRAKRDGEEWLSAYLCLSEKSPVKEVTTGHFSLTLPRSPPKQDLKFDVPGRKEFAVGQENYGWGADKFVRYAEFVSHFEGYLTWSDSLTVLVEGKLSCGVEPNQKDILLMPDESSAELEANIRKQTCDKLGKLFDAGLFTDFLVKAKDSNGKMKQLKVHRNILAAQSEVFGAMDVKECREGVLKIEDISFEVMEALVRFLYTSGLPPSAKPRCSGLATTLRNLFFSKGSKETKTTDFDLGLLIAADKYQLEGLKALVERRLTASLSVENVCSLLVYADRHKAPFLRARCIEFIRQSLKRVVKTEGWRQLCTLEYAHLTVDLFGDGEEVVTIDENNNADELKTT